MKLLKKPVTLGLNVILFVLISAKHFLMYMYMKLNRNLYSKPRKCCGISLCVCPVFFNLKKYMGTLQSEEWRMKLKLNFAQ